MTEVTLKVMPRPESERTLVLRGLDDLTGQPRDDGSFGLAVRCVRGGACAELGVPGLRGCLWWPGIVVGIAGAGGHAGAAGGIAASVAHRAPRWSNLLAPFGTAEIVDDVVSAAIWVAVRDVQPFAASDTLGAWPVWRIVCPPASGGALGERLARDSGGDVIYDWGGGLNLGGLATQARCPGRVGARARQCRGRSRHAAACVRRGPPQRRCVSSFCRTALPRSANASARVSIRRASSTAVGW